MEMNKILKDANSTHINIFMYLDLFNAFIMYNIVHVYDILHHTHYRNPFINLFLVLVFCLVCFISTV